jgi:hypothetical protein
MDMRPYRKAKFVKVADVAEPYQQRIAGVVEGKFEKPELVFENGDKLSLSATNVDTLTAAFGFESDAWIGHVVELYPGEGEYQGESVAMVMVRAITAGEKQDVEPVRRAPSKPPVTKQSGGGGLNDDIPFGPCM